MNRQRRPVLLVSITAMLALICGIASAAPAAPSAPASLFDSCRTAPSTATAIQESTGTQADLILPAEPPAWLPQAPPGTGCSAAFCAACAANGELCVNARICICI